MRGRGRPPHLPAFHVRALRRGATVMLHLHNGHTYSLNGHTLLNGHTYHPKAEREQKAAAREKRAKEAGEAQNASKPSSNGVITSGKARDLRSQAEGANGRTVVPTVNGQELDGNASDGSDLVVDDSDDELEGDLGSMGGGGDMDSADGLDASADNARALLEKLRRSSLSSGVGLQGVSESGNGVAGAPGDEPSGGGPGGLRRAPSALSRQRKQTSVAGRASSMFSKVRHTVSRATVSREAVTAHVTC